MLKAPFSRYAGPLEREAGGSWCEERPCLGTSVEWRFSTEDARIKVRTLYPSIDT
jgi:hypothetical protein